jgi:hypothetical protein
LSPPHQPNPSSGNRQRANDMDSSHHMATVTVTELDLSTSYPNTIVDRISAVPGLKPSTGTSRKISISPFSQPTNPAQTNFFFF